MKKLIALILVLVLAIGSMPALAENVEDMATPMEIAESEMDLANTNLPNPELLQWAQMNYDVISAMNNESFMVSLMQEIKAMDKESAYRYWASIYAATLVIMKTATKNVTSCVQGLIIDANRNGISEPLGAVEKAIYIAASVLAPVIISVVCKPTYHQYRYYSYYDSSNRDIALALSMTSLMAVYGIRKGMVFRQTKQGIMQLDKDIITNEDTWSISSDYIDRMTPRELALSNTVAGTFRLIGACKELLDWLLVIKPAVAEKYMHIDNYITQAQQSVDALFETLNGWANGEKKTDTVLFIFPRSRDYQFGDLKKAISQFSKDKNIKSLINLYYSNEALAEMSAN